MQGSNCALRSANLNSGDVRAGLKISAERANRPDRIDTRGPDLRLHVHIRCRVEHVVERQRGDDVMGRDRIIPRLARRGLVHGRTGGTRAPAPRAQMALRIGVGLHLDRAVLNSLERGQTGMSRPCVRSGVGCGCPS